MANATPYGERVSPMAAARQGRTETLRVRPWRALALTPVAVSSGNRRPSGSPVPYGGKPA
ncbi:hypothetical protein SAMD00079811_77360 (plasmid) [Scytonema sp. HK-05]|uniref:hypothetical protein n=1 Tax=Scytonema sp. HK-05 TaxID=1137095 RepID=UPI000B0DAD80|nr:hypothetical protein [Scytonema sp. HK-05]BAY50107.1 hypothetical protein SAMD00079811_77360 [Scytonema sp. HK-05]